MIIATSNVCIAQYTGERANNYNSDYNRERREVQKNYEKQADLNRQPNAPSTRTNSGFTESEAEQINNEWNRIWGKSAKKEVSSEEIRRNYDAYQLQKQKDDEANWALWAIERKNDAVFEAPLRDKLTKDGFYPIEINGMCTDYRNNKTGGHDQNTYFMKNIFQANVIIENLRLNYETASFESLAVQIKNLVELRAPFTAIDYITVIEDRFPDKKIEIQRLKLEIAHCFIKDYAFLFGSNSNEEVLQKFMDFYTVAEDNDAQLNTKLQVMVPKDKWQYYSPYKLIFSLCNWHLECKTCSSSEIYKKYKNKLAYYQDRQKKQN